MSQRGSWVRQRCPVAFVTGASNWYWLSFGQGLLSLQQVRVEGECYFFCSFMFFHFPLYSLSLSFFSSTTISFLPFSGRQYKMTQKGWRIIKPQHNQSIIVINQTWKSYFIIFAYFFFQGSRIISMEVQNFCGVLIWSKLQYLPNAFSVTGLRKQCRPTLDALMNKASNYREQG